MVTYTKLGFGYMNPALAGRDPPRLRGGPRLCHPRSPAVDPGQPGREAELKAEIRAKLFLAVLGLAVPALILVGAIAYIGGEKAVTHATFEHLTSVRAAKARQISSYLEQVRAQAETLSEPDDRQGHARVPGRPPRASDEPATAEERIGLAYYTDLSAAA